MHNTVIFSQVYLNTAEQGRLMAVCLELTRRLNPGWPLMLMDNASPLDPFAFMPREWVEHYHRFTDAIGHFSPKYTHEHDEPRDGPGRAIMTALHLARDAGYDRAVHMEADALCAVPFEDGFRRMTKPTACLPRIKWGYLDWQVWWIADLKWLVDDHRFLDKYNWPAKTKHDKEGERIYEDLLAGFLEVIPLKGGRGDGYYKPDGEWVSGWIRADNLAAVFPGGIDYITHVHTSTFAEFLRLNGHDDLAEKL